jgi:hypothetical protein
MAEYRLGQIDEAKARLERLRGVLRSERCGSDEEAETLC